VDGFDPLRRIVLLSASLGDAESAAAKRPATARADLGGELDERRELDERL